MTDLEKQEFADMIVERVKTALDKQPITYDLAYIPDNWTTEDVIKHLKSEGIAFIHSNSNYGNYQGSK